MPKRTAGEPLNEFIGKFMKSQHDRKKWPKEKQRLAVGYAEAREGAKRGRK
jgi:hypothetical protein